MSVAGRVECQCLIARAWRMRGNVVDVRGGYIRRIISRNKLRRLAAVLGRRDGALWIVRVAAPEHMPHVVG